MSNTQLSRIQIFVSFTGQYVSVSVCSSLYPSSSYVILSRLVTDDDCLDAFSLTNPVSLITTVDNEQQILQRILQGNEGSNKYHYGECSDLFGRKLLLVAKESNSYLSTLISSGFQFALFSYSDVIFDSFNRYINSYANSYIGVILELQKSARETQEKLRDNFGCLMCNTSPKNIAFFPCGHVMFCKECAHQLDMKLNKRLVGASRKFRCPQCSKAVNIIREIKN